MPRDYPYGMKSLSCAVWLSKRLAGGPVPSAVLNSEALALGFGRYALENAKARIGVRSSPRAGVWTASLSKGQGER